MIKNMLQAASKMLVQKDDGEEKDPTASFRSRVRCAKIIIDEIVAGMERRPMYDPETNKLNQEYDLPIIPVKSAKKSTVTEPKGKMMVDHGRITSIEGVDLETTMVDIDGKVMKASDAIGKSFQNVKFV